MICVLSAAGCFTRDGINIAKYFELADKSKTFWSCVMLVLTNGHKYGQTDAKSHDRLHQSLENPKCSQVLKSLIENSR